MASGNSRAQMNTSRMLIRGVIRDSATQLVVPYASVSIIGTTRGTSADDKGFFCLTLEPNDLPRHLNVSSIGYKTAVFPIGQLPDSTTLILVQATNMLAEVFIRGDSMNSREIVRKAIRNFSKNYIQSPFACEFMSKLVVIGHGTADTTVAECILKGYYPGYQSLGKRKFQITEARITGHDPFRGHYVPTHEIHAIDVIANPEKFGVFNEANLGNITFRYDGSTLYERDTVFKISYTISKPAKKVTGYGAPLLFFKGHLTIASNLAIVEHSTETDRTTSRIIYRKIDGFYFPYSIVGTRNRPTNHQHTSVYTIENHLRLLNVSTQNTQPIENGSNEVDLSKVKYNKHFWEQHYPSRNK